MLLDFSSNSVYTVSTMKTMKINIRKARERFSEIINTVAIKGERVILMSKNTPKAAIVSLKDMELLESRSLTKAKRLTRLNKIRTIRKKLCQNGVVSDSVITLRKTREDRVGKIPRSH